MEAKMIKKTLFLIQAGDESTDFRGESVSGTIHTYVMIEEGTSNQDLLGLECVKETTNLYINDESDTSRVVKKEIRFKITQKMIDAVTSNEEREAKRKIENEKKDKIYNDFKKEREAVVSQLLEEKRIKKSDDENTFKITKKFWEIWADKKEDFKAIGIMIMKAGGWELII